MRFASLFKFIFIGCECVFICVSPNQFRRTMKNSTPVRQTAISQFISLNFISFPFYRIFHLNGCVEKKKLKLGKAQSILSLFVECICASNSNEQRNNNRGNDDYEWLKIAHIKINWDRVRILCWVRSKIAHLSLQKLCKLQPRTKSATKKIGKYMNRLDYSHGLASTPSAWMKIVCFNKSDFWQCSLETLTAELCI